MSARAAILSLAFAGALAACVPQATMPLESPTVRVDGLREVKSKYFDVVFVRPDADFSQYRELLIEESELAFRTPDRSKRQFPLSKEQKDRFHELVDARFQKEFSASGTLRLTDNTGPGTLRLRVRVQDIVASVPQRSLGGIGGDLFLLALGEATLVIELSDSETNEILARVFDREATEGSAIAQKQGAPVTRWDDVEAFCQRWAKTARERLDVVVSGNY